MSPFEIMALGAFVGLLALSGATLGLWLIVALASFQGSRARCRNKRRASKPD